MDTANTPPSFPNFWLKPKAFIFISVPFNQTVLANTISVFLVNAKPATFKPIDSKPLTFAVFAFAQPEVRPQGFISNSLAPD